MNLKKVCIVGAGAIGGFLGAKLSNSGLVEVSALARGQTLEALRTHGWRLNTAAGLMQSPVEASSDAARLGRQDLVIIAVKGQDLAGVARQIAPLIDEESLILPAMNGVPWWFVGSHPALQGPSFECLDPGGVIAQTMPRDRVIGAVLHASTSVVEPGLVQHKMGQGLIVGEPAGGHSERVERIVALLAASGFDVTHSENVRYDIWYKLWGNLTMNPVSAMTGATIDRILDDPLVRRLCSAAMTEAAQLGARIGCAIAQTPEDRHLVTAKLGAFKTSMLQDVEAGRMLELDSIVAVVHEMGQRLGIATPNIDAILGLSRLFGRVHGLYPEQSGR